jgi:hypothetical protein
MLAETSGRVKVFSLVVGPENAVKPFPVPPLAAEKIPVVILATSRLGISAATRAANWRAFAAVERST